MLGFYVNFPQNAHKLAVFFNSISNKRLQQALTQTFLKLNNETFRLEEVANPSVPHCRVVFEFGIADENDFNYLDSHEKDKLLKAISKKTFPVTDFFSVIRYYRIGEEKKSRLRFDYYMIRFMFDKNLIEIRVFHEKGPMHVSPEELIEFVVARINSTFSKKALKPLEFS
jgi:hypothetical protein